MEELALLGFGFILILIAIAFRVNWERNGDEIKTFDKFFEDYKGKTILLRYSDQTRWFLLRVADTLETLAPNKVRMFPVGLDENMEDHTISELYFDCEGCSVFVKKPDLKSLASGTSLPYT